MARQLTYATEDVDLIQPRDEQQRRVLALAVKHGLLTPMQWDHPPTHFGSNRPSFSEICAFAAALDQPPSPPDGYTREGFLQLLHERLAASHLAGRDGEGFPASSLKLLQHYLDQLLPVADPVLPDDLCDAYGVPRGSRRSEVADDHAG